MISWLLKRRWPFRIAIGGLVVGAGASALAGTIAGMNDFSGWGVGHEDILRIEVEVASSLQPGIDQFFASKVSSSFVVRYDGKTFGLARRRSPGLDFDLPVDSFGHSTTITFGRALFKMDLPFLQFHEASATYSFRETWSLAPGAELINEDEINLADLDKRLLDPPFDPASLIRKGLYDIEGARLPVSGWGIGGNDVSQMLSAVVMGYDLDDRPGEEGMSAALGTISTLDLESQPGGDDVGMAGIIAMLALGGAALFITLEINRDKFDNYH